MYAAGLLNYSEHPMKVIIDTDAGVDDAVALFLALAAHKDPKCPFEIIGITCVLGNTGVDNVCRNVFTVLDSTGVSNIPVFRGADTPLVQPFIRGESPFFGVDGFGGVHSLPNIPVVKQERTLEKESAPLALVRLAREFQGELTVVALGPCTNLGIAINIDPNFVKNVKELYIMGGNSHGVGNIRPCVEFNFFVDPESAFVVLSAAWNQKIVMVPLETCKLAMSSMEWRKQVLGTIKSSCSISLKKGLLQRFEKDYGSWCSCDAVCMAVLLKPSIISKSSTNYCTVELQGAHTRGQVVVDHPQKTGKPHNVTIIEQIQLAELERMLLSTFHPSTFI
ncbi:Inosine-uridine preferring nucleoside hydrolase [Orchesella cincta]|uniref:Inosine-uridine preferring nucleoside hydrolase n=1 Tax=Orchesella cincta TaxID=48709 RepID=A0A1D2MCH6_ORCCI|nr:Inosine-uridine preferring nucleoside hydrolase [Orchesella cincta]